MSDDFYYTKYLKYKAKYLNLIKQTGGEIKCTYEKLETNEIYKDGDRGNNHQVCCEDTTTKKKACEHTFFASKSPGNPKAILEKRAKDQLAKPPATPRKP